MGGGGSEVVAHHRLDVDDDLLRAREGHDQVLLVDVAPAGEEAVGGQEQEQVLPLQPQVVLVEHLRGGNMKNEALGTISSCLRSNLCSDFCGNYDHYGLCST